MPDRTAEPKQFLAAPPAGTAGLRRGLGVDRGADTAGRMCGRAA
ncbi:hypothetical protein [Mycolicibacterium duvalii]|nr:hypothetical protein [Mycolicibacterium duvalii]